MGTNGKWVPNIKQLLLDELNDEQEAAVRSSARRLLVVAGAGAGKTEVMARRVVWWLAVDGIPQERLVAFTFTEAAAEELKFRIRQWVEKATVANEPPSLDKVYIGTIHGFCLQALRQFRPEVYYDYEVLDDLSRLALVERFGRDVLALKTFQDVCVKEALDAGKPYGPGHFDCVRDFLRGYDLLNEHDLFEPKLSERPIPNDVAESSDWCREARLVTKVGTSEKSQAFADSAARLYALMKARRFLDFSTSQSELTRRMRDDGDVAAKIAAVKTCLVVDEVQDINPVQRQIIEAFVGPEGRLTAVGDHRQAIYGFRGGRVEIMAKLHDDVKAEADGDIVYLKANYRSTPRIIELANLWSNSISPSGSMPNPAMQHGNKSRVDHHSNHVSTQSFVDHDAEAEWLATTIANLVRDGKSSAAHDIRKKDGTISDRGITYGDIAILVRSSTSVRTYEQRLRLEGIPAIVRAGPGLFSQPEMLLFVSCLALAAGMEKYMGGAIIRTITEVLSCGSTPKDVLKASARELESYGFKLESGTLTRLENLATAIRHRCKPEAPAGDLALIRTKDAAKWCKGTAKLRRVFPQTILQWFFAEAGIARWDRSDDSAASVMFHLGQLSTAVKGLETPGWTRPGDLRSQVIGLINWLAGSGRGGAGELLVPPNAVTISTIHGAKGLEFPAVFLADVKPQRFPSKFAKSPVTVPFDGKIVKKLRLEDLSDDDAYNSERRLMYVALTRAERYLFVSYSGKSTSAFVKALYPLIESVGGAAGPSVKSIEKSLHLAVTDRRREDRLSTSFSDLRYFIECPHDFYLRKVLGFTPTIDQAFGYGKGMHNLLREIHTEPKKWAKLAKDPAKLRSEAEKLVASGLFYLRYTTQDPLENMRNSAADGVVRYVTNFANELSTLNFEPERAFETLLPKDNVLITGAIDLVRFDNPPRVTIIDFKSGLAESENDGAMNTELMKRQIGIYGLAAKSELQLEPEKGLVRYIGEPDPKKAELSIDLTSSELTKVRESVSNAVQNIRARKFHDGPTGIVKDRCSGCDFHLGCGVKLRSLRKPK